MKAYHSAVLESAIREYLETEKSQYQIAREYGIPRSTLNDHIHRLYGYVDRDMARRARGLPSLKAPDKSELFLSTYPDMSDRTSEPPQCPVPDMSGNKGGPRGRRWIPWVIAAVLVGSALLILYLWWRWQRGEAVEEPEGPRQPPQPQPSDEELIEKRWREAFEGY